jgi:predicted ATPase
MMRDFTICDALRAIAKPVQKPIHCPSASCDGNAMIQELTLKNFKSFGEPQPESGTSPKPWNGEKIKFGGLSLIIGTNASGKSNIRDALRFIHGISRGYTLPEIIGEKYGEGGELQWKGIRGGVRETVTRNGHPENTKFTIGIRTQLLTEDGGGEAEYSITVDVGDKTKQPSVIHEHFSKDGISAFICESVEANQVVVHIDKYRYEMPYSQFGGPALTKLNQTVGESKTEDLKQFETELRATAKAIDNCARFVRTIASTRFLDLDPQSLRRPSIPGQTILGDKGENLSSVLQAICKKPDGKEALIAWTRELTPLDVTDLKFPNVSLDGKIQLQLVEQGGREISAESASDGTLRFLAMAGAMLGTAPARFYFFEEMENGIHPNRAHLLVNLLQSSTRKGKIQVVGTTHSPALLNFLDTQTLRDASLVYRAGSISKIRSFADITSLSEVMPGSGAGELFGAGWFEDVASFMEPDGVR